MNIQTGASRLVHEKQWTKSLKGQVGLLTHSAAVIENYELSALALKKLLGPRLSVLFGPQHGLVSDVQYNMEESAHYEHPYFKMKVFSLYSETRVPTDEMLEGLSTVLVDMQDVGTRIYTYIYTMTLLMGACGKKGIKVVVLDRPNPIGGVELEGNILEDKFKSFVGLFPLPVRHGLTMGEVALMAQKYFAVDCELEVIPVAGLKRSMTFTETKLPWVLPSPNIATPESAFSFVGTVLFEGTNISEGRGTTRALEMVGHPKIEPFSLAQKYEKKWQELGLQGFVLRPCVFMPTFNKHQKKTCGGFQIHVTDEKKFRPWRVGQILCKIFHQELGADFAWNKEPYEYEFSTLAIDLINGTDKIRQLIEKKGLTLEDHLHELEKIEKVGQQKYLDQRESILLYS